jgi:hypothetical protein
MTSPPVQPTCNTIDTAASIKSTRRNTAVRVVVTDVGPHE